MKRIIITAHFYDVINQTRNNMDSLNTIYIQIRQRYSILKKSSYNKKCSEGTVIYDYSLFL
jgi:hypothetical protein